MTDHPAAAEPSAPLAPIPLNAEQELAAKTWAADDRLWTTQETVELNLRVFARVVLAALRQAEARPNAVDSHDIVRFSQTDMDRQTKPLHVEIERLKARQAEAEGRQDGLARSPDTKEDP